MSVIATEGQRFSDVVKLELWPEHAVCREVVTMYDSAATLQIGSVLGKFIASPTGTASAVTGTGNGTMGAITMTSNANLVLGVYTLKIVKAAANAGDFVLTDPNGKVVGYGTVAVAFAQGGFAFTLADGATDFVVGDYLTITVAGTEKYKFVEATATDGSEVARGIYIGNINGVAQDLVLAANTDTTVLMLARGPAIVSKSNLKYGTSVNTDAEKAALYAQLKAVEIYAETTV